MYDDKAKCSAVTGKEEHISAVSTQLRETPSILIVSQQSLKGQGWLYLDPS